MKDKFIQYQNSAIYYQTTGSGLPVVFIHGFAEDSSIWDNQVEFLKNDYTLIVPDLPGSGRSQFIDKDNIAIEDYAEVIKQILAEEKIGQCIMIGHSMGGYITLAFAEKYPGSLITFGLFHSTAFPDDAAKIESRRKAIRFIEKEGAFPFLKTTIPGLFYEQGNSSLSEALIEKGKSFIAQALIQYYNAMIARPDRTKILTNTTMPLLFIIGEYDKAIPVKQQLEQSHLPEHSFIHILRDSAHMGMLEEKAKSNEILANFLLSQNNNK